MQPTLLLKKSKQMGWFVNFLKCSESIKSTRRQITINQMEHSKGLSGPFYEMINKYHHTRQTEWDDYVYDYDYDDYVERNQY